MSERTDLVLNETALQLGKILSALVNIAPIPPEPGQSKTIVYYSDGSSQEFDIDGELYGFDLTSETADIVKVEIGNTVTDIGSEAFARQYWLTDVSLPNSLTSIGYGAFTEAYALSSPIVIPNTVTNIEYDIFSSCNALSSITIGTGITELPGFAFCGTSIASIIVPNNITSIGESVFQMCQDLSSITIGNNVVTIGEWAFYKAEKLQSILLPNSLTSIGPKIFEDCYGLTSIIFGSNIEEIGYEAFQNCEYLPSITIPASVTTIGENAFHYCFRLSSITFEGKTISDVQGMDYFPWDINVHSHDPSYGLAPSCDVHCSDGTMTIVNGEVTEP